jgi:hypothetical protein
MNLLLVSQVWIFITGALSAFMIHSADRKVRLAACVIALAGQIAWVYAAIQADQFGILLVDFIYTAGWIRGFVNNRSK